MWILDFIVLLKSENNPIEILYMVGELKFVVHLNLGNLSNFVFRNNNVSKLVYTFLIFLTGVTPTPVHDDTSGEDTSDEEDDDRTDGATGEAQDDVSV